MTLTVRDHEIIQSLAARIRLLSLKQIARHWWRQSQHAEDTARKRLATLVSQGLLTSATVLAAELPALDAPLCVWRPGQQPPDFGGLAWKLADRWVSEPRLCRAYLATAQAARRFGGRARGKIKNRYQATHDLGVAEVYLRLRTERAELAEHWVGEDVLAPHRRGQERRQAW